jgi:hypothetical protein
VGTFVQLVSERLNQSLPILNQILEMKPNDGDKAQTMANGTCQWHCKCTGFVNNPQVNSKIKTVGYTFINKQPKGVGVAGLTEIKANSVF